MGGANENPNPIDFMHRLKWYVLGKYSPGDISINKNCEKDNDQPLTTPLEDEEVCLTAPLFMSIISVPTEIPKTDADRLAHLQFVDEDCQIDVELPSTTLNEQALKYLTGYVAHRFRNKYPFLGTASRDDDNLPQTSELDWIQFISRGHLLQPSNELLQAAHVMETLFLAFHGPEIRKTSNIVQTLVAMIHDKIKNNFHVPQEVLTCLVRTRTYIRIRELNKSVMKQQLKNKSTKKMKKILGK
jgi:hypothetical protein